MNIETDKQRRYVTADVQKAVKMARQRRLEP